MGRWDDDNGRTVSFLPTYVYDAMTVIEHMRVGFLSFHLVLRFFVLPFCCCFFKFFFLSFPFLSFPFLSFGVGNEVDP